MFSYGSEEKGNIFGIVSYSKAQYNPELFHLVILSFSGYIVHYIINDLMIRNGEFSFSARSFHPIFGLSV